jgi:hypothetical protein
MPSVMGYWYRLDTLSPNPSPCEGVGDSAYPIG